MKIKRKQFAPLVLLLLILAIVPFSVDLVQKRIQPKPKAAGAETVANPKITGLVLPSILGFQSDLFTGSSSVAYPMAVPAGLGGFKPNLSLSYSSSGVDDNHVGVKTSTLDGWKRKYNSQAGVAGFGWNLTGVDGITKNGQGEFYLSVGGASYKLISQSYDDQGKPTSTSWETSPKGFLKITHFEGDWGHHPWEVMTKDGTKYLFGETEADRAWDINTPDPAHPESQAPVVYRWMISKIIDTHNNLMQFTYEKEEQQIAIDYADLHPEADRTCEGKEQGKNYVRAIRPKTISWSEGHYRVEFDWENRDDGNIGAIINGEQAGKSCKQTQYTTQRLNQIRVLVDGALLRKYLLSYRYTRLNGDYPLRPIVHSLLNRITMYGTDGTSSLPPYTFGYEGDVVGSDNNKGNEVYLSWANNGYAGKVTFTYDRVSPPTIIQNGETRIYDAVQRARVIKRVTEDGTGNYLVNKANYIDNGQGYAQLDVRNNQLKNYEFLGFTVAEDVLYEKNKDGSNPADIVVKSKKYSYQKDTVVIGSSTFHYPDPRKGKSFKTEVLNKNDAVLSINEENWTYNPKPTFNPVDSSIDRSYSPLVLLSSSQNTTEGKTTKTSFEYDQYANTTKTIGEGDTSKTGDERFTQTTYYYNTASWIIGKPQLSQLYRGTPTSNPQEINRTGYYYDEQGWGQPPAKGDVTAIDKVGLNPEVHLMTRTKYNAYGNPTEATDPKGNKTTTEYDPVYHLFPKKVTNVLGQFTETEYDYLLGVPLWVKDSNGIQTNFRYDKFGRATKIIKIGDTEDRPTIEYVIRDQTPMVVGTKSRIESGTDQIMESYQFYNGLGQLMQEQSYGPNSGQIIVSNNVYNSRGAVIEKPIAYYQTATIGTYQTPLNALKTVTEYDPLGRAVKVTNTDGTFATTSYNGFNKTVTNEAGVWKIFENDAFGNLIQLTEQSDSGNIMTKYEYDIALGSLTKVVDHKNNQTTIAYDSLGRKTEMRDPDLGRWQYPKYDLNSNLEEQIDAKNQKIIFQYDSLNRLKKKIYPDNSFVEYFYDEGVYGKGKRTRMVDTSGSTVTEYDNRGRVTKETKNIIVNSQTHTFITQFTYDNLDRIKTITYPDSEVAQYAYNRTGQPWKLTAGGQPIVTETAYSALGQVRQQNYGNNTQTVNRYYADDPGDPTSLRLKSITTTGPPGTLFAKNYTYDPVGNIRQISGQGETENFSYDKLNRLLGASTAYNASYTYDEIGNIRTKVEGADSRTLEYTNPLHVHAPNRVNGVEYLYDENGNLRQDELRTIVYDYENRPKEITMMTTPTPTPTGGPTPTATPTPSQPPSGEERRVNTGGASYLDGQNHQWAADKAYSAGSFGYTTTATSTYSVTNPIANTPNDALYQNERYANQDWNYRFDLPNGNYRVTLKFAEIYFADCAVGKRQFHVKIQGVQVLTSFDTFATAGACYSAIDRSFDTTVSNGYLNIDFIKIAYKDTPKVNAMEITPLGGGTTPTPTSSITYDCDFNNDTKVDAYDLDRLLVDYDPATYVTKETDVNNDHYVNSVDYSICLVRISP